MSYIVKVLKDKHKSTTVIYPKIIEECLPDEYQGLLSKLDRSLYITETEPTELLGGMVTYYEIPKNTINNKKPGVDISSGDLILYYNSTIREPKTLYMVSYTSLTTCTGIKICDFVNKDYVKANPTLAGTEADLEGLEVNGIKYKAGGGGGGSQLYQHNISFEYADGAKNIYFNVTVISDSNTAFTDNTLATYLNTKGLTSDKKSVIASGFWYNIVPQNQLPVMAIYETSGSIYVKIAFGGSLASNQLPSDVTVTDTVIAL